MSSSIKNYLGLNTFISSEISKSLGILSRLRHFVPQAALLNIYRSLIQPYLSCGVAVWGQGARSSLENVSIMQKRALRLITLQNYLVIHQKNNAVIQGLQRLVVSILNIWEQNMWKILFQDWVQGSGIVFPSVFVLYLSINLGLLHRQLLNILMR